MRVNFVTDPFEATIHLDGEPLTDSNGIPLRTPCTVPDVPARVHRVVFMHDVRGTLEIGPIDFAKKRQIVGRWIPDS